MLLKYGQRYRLTLQNDRLTLQNAVRLLITKITQP